MRMPHQRLSPLWLYFDNIALDERMTAVRQIEALGLTGGRAPHRDDASRFRPRWRAP
jgi:hypothetical protein